MQGLGFNGHLKTLWDETIISLSKVRRWSLEAHVKPGPSKDYMVIVETKKKSIHKYREKRGYLSASVWDLGGEKNSSPEIYNYRPIPHMALKLKCILLV